MTWTVHNGDNLEAMLAMADNSIDVIIQDPPAGVAFMGKAWDDFERTEFVAFMEARFKEQFRILKPGGHCISWGIPRTEHWTAWAAENAGFFIRDKLAWLYGQGFPKSHNIAKAIQKADGVKPLEVLPATLGMANNPQWNALENRYVMPETDGEAATWDGWGTALKPAMELWIWAQKPISERTIVANVRRWGTGAINIDGCRIAFSSEADMEAADPGTTTSGNIVGGGVATERKEFVSPSVARRRAATKTPGADNPTMPNRTSLERYKEERAGEAIGRWPANVTLGHSPTCGPRGREGEASAERRYAESGEGFTMTPGPRGGDEKGRWPANVTLGHMDTCVPAGTRQVPTGTAVRRNGGGGDIFGGAGRPKLAGPAPDAGHADENGLETVDAWTCDPNCAVRLLDEQSGDADAKPERTGRRGGSAMFDSPTMGTPELDGRWPADPGGGASRFFYTAKPARSEKEAGVAVKPVIDDPAQVGLFALPDEKPIADGSQGLDTAGRTLEREDGSATLAARFVARERAMDHPTVKPVELMRWLVRLFTPPKGVVLDAFAGSGTTGVAAVLEGHDVILIEQDPKYAEYCRARLRWAENPHGGA